MKSLKAVLLAMLMLIPFALAGPVVQVDITGTSITPIYTEQKFEPLVFLRAPGGRVLFDDPYGLYANGNIETRPNNYAFTGEQVQWKVLVWDKNGVPEKIFDVFAGWVDQTNGPLDPEMQMNCQQTTGCYEGQLLSDCGYSNVRRPGDQEDQQYFREATMGEYLCTLTVEPSCHGQKWFGVKAIDQDFLNGTMQEAESWFCNPELDLYVSGDLDFGTLGPGEQGATTFSVENAAEAGSGVQAVIAISGTDFYDPASSGALCPTSNLLALQGDGNSFTYGFWYTAVKGAMTTYGPKRIPYGAVINEADPIFSGATSAQQWRKWTGSPTLLDQALSPGSEISMTLHLGIPQPCNGAFTDGHIYLYSWAI